MPIHPQEDPCCDVRALEVSQAAHLIPSPSDSHDRSPADTRAAHGSLSSTESDDYDEHSGFENGPPPVDGPQQSTASPFCDFDRYTPGVFDIL